MSFSTRIQLSPAMRAAILSSVLAACSSDSNVGMKGGVAMIGRPTVATLQTATFALG